MAGPGLRGYVLASTWTPKEPRSTINGVPGKINVAERGLPESKTDPLREDFDPSRGLWNDLLNFTVILMGWDYKSEPILGKKMPSV